MASMITSLPLGLFTAFCSSSHKEAESTPPPLEFRLGLCLALTNRYGRCDIIVLSLGRE